jgi:hypothetical protein
MLLVVVVDKTDTQGPADGHIISLHSPAKGGGGKRGLGFWLPTSDDGSLDERAP